MDTIVVGLCRTRSSQDALAWAARRAAQTNACLRVTTSAALPAPVGGPAGCAFPVVDPTRLVRGVRQWQEHVVRETLEEVGISDELRVDHVIGFGDPIRLFRTATESADLLVLGESRHRFFSIVSRARKHVSCPVVTVSADSPL